MDYLIDISGTCNLRCPSCPVGNFNSNTFTENSRKKGFMSFSYFEKLIEKIINESKQDAAPPEIYLYNWGESLIHPELVKFLDIINENNIPFYISSNFNTEIDLRPIIKSKPIILRISLSGSSNEIYKKGHEKGDINLVISNLYKVKYLSDKLNLPTSNIQIFYHIYKDNCNDDLLRMFNICNDLGFQFSPTIAYFMPIEKIMYSMMGSDKFTDRDKETMNRMWVNIEETLEIASHVNDRSCSLQTNQIVINHDGKIALCCAVYDPIFFIADDYLKINRDELMRKKSAHEFCAICTDHGINNVAVYKPQKLWDDIVISKQKKEKTKFITRMFSHPSIENNPNFIE